jgi:DNA-binding transcriptional ArsR family regulator
MVTQRTASLDGVFHALADPTRRAMLRALSGGPRNIRELAEPFSMSFVAASKHVRVLESAGLLRRRVEGRSHFCRLNPKPLASAHAWLAFYEGFWSQRLDDLEALLKAEDSAAHAPAKKARKKGPQERKLP